MLWAAMLPTLAFARAVSEPLTDTRILNSIQLLRSRDLLVCKDAIEWLRSAGEAALPELAKAIESNDWEIRQGAAEALVRMGKSGESTLLQAAKAGNPTAIEALPGVGPAAIQVLHELIMWSSSKLQKAAAAALSGMGAAAVPTLRDGLRSADPHVRECCANALGWVGPPAQETVPALVGLLLSDPPIQGTVARALRRIRIESKGLETQLSSKLTDANSSVRQGAVLGLLAVRKPEQATFQKLMAAARRDTESLVRSAALTSLALISPGDEDVVRALVDALSETRNPNFSAEFASALIWMENRKKVASEMTVLLKHGEPAVRQMAAHVLGRLGSDARFAIPFLREKLSDPDLKVRSSAVQALGALGNDAKEAAVDIATALSDGRISVFQAAHTLGHLESPDAAVVSVLIAHLNIQASDKSREEEAKRQASSSGGRRSTLAALISALGASGPGASEAVSLITKLANDQDPLVRQAAILALAKISPDPASIVNLALSRLQDQDPSVRRRAADALGLLSQHAGRGIPGLMRGLEDSDTLVRLSCTRALGQVGSKEAMPPLRLVLRDKSHEVRIEAAVALLKNRSDSEEAWQALQDELQNPISGAREYVAAKLGELGPLAGRAVLQLRKLLADRAERVRAAAAQALGAIGPAATVAVAELKLASDDLEPSVRKEAMGALRRLALSEKRP